MRDMPTGSMWSEWEEIKTKEQKEMEEHKKCPCCGGEDVSMSTSGILCGVTGCHKCDVTGPICDTCDESREHWNTRTATNKNLYMEYFTSGAGYGKTATNRRIHEEWLEKVTGLQKGDWSVMENKKQTAREWAESFHIGTEPSGANIIANHETIFWGVPSFLDEYDRRKEEEQAGRSWIRLPFKRGDDFYYVDGLSITKLQFRHANVYDDGLYLRAMTTCSSYNIKDCFKTLDEAAAHYKKEYGND